MEVIKNFFTGLLVISTFGVLIALPSIFPAIGVIILGIIALGLVALLIAFLTHIGGGVREAWRDHCKERDRIEKEYQELNRSIENHYRNTTNGS